MIHDGGVVAAELSKVVAGAPQLITIGTDKTLTIWDTISFKDIVTFWNQQPFAARENASSTIIPTCLVVVDISNGGKFLIDKEVLLSIKVLIIAFTCFRQPHRHSWGPCGLLDLLDLELLLL
nr:augmin subunit 5 [Quercus suber]